MHRQTKATSIPKEVKEVVWTRDGGHCIFCGSPNAGPHCHFVRRSQGGLGIEQNIWTGCNVCHEIFDSEGREGPMHQELAERMKAYYPGWDEEQMVYRKWG